MQLEHFSRALSDPSTELTYPALTGARKQSVVNAERPNLAAFMRKNRYEYEAKYIETYGTGEEHVMNKVYQSYKEANLTISFST